MLECFLWGVERGKLELNDSVILTEKKGKIHLDKG